MCAMIQERSKVFTTGQAIVNPDNYVIKKKVWADNKFSNTHMASLSIAVCYSKSITNGDELIAIKLKAKLLEHCTNFPDVALSTIKRLENNCTSVMLSYGI